MQKEDARKRISELVAHFDEQIDTLKQGDYNETQTRIDFINPFFKALGWDIDNENGYAEAYREVIHEDKTKVKEGKSEKTKAPDYAFRLGGGKRLFFVEAKKPSVAIKDDIVPAYQLRRYGWSAKLPISIITDFEEFAVYDCTKKPYPGDKASTARIKYITYKDYDKEFDFLWDTFSKEKVLTGSFDRFVQSDKQKRGTETVDKEFLVSLDEWRKYLATNIAWNNKNLNEDEINYAVQMTIDRIIFLRIAEDRFVERYGRLKECLTKGIFYRNLFDYFKEADKKYNSGLFDFAKDKITEKLIVENKAVKSILNDLYYPESPFEFSVLPVEILGSAYEQFLGKVIRLTPGHIAKIDEKPEVRKAGGVYYTPQYIVEYIVENTIGKLIEGKSPAEISKLKIVDPACGSGSFLIGAYQHLLTYHKDYYSQNGKPSKGKKDSLLTPEGNLTTAEKKRILTNNIYGVDIDVNAVEVTKLSLLLKCMEGETEASIATQMKLFHERVLPTLDNNIKDGNSLIDTDYYSSELDFGEEKKIKPFNWQRAFPEIFKNDGFDAVIGNPPWGAEFNQNEVEYLIKKYPQIPQKTKDSYFAFVFRALNFLKPNRYLGFIIPNTWLLINTAQSFREFILKYKIDELIDYGDGLFKDATVESATIILQNEEDKNGICKVKRIKKSEVIINNNVKKSIWLNDKFKRIIIEKDEQTDKLQKHIWNNNAEAFEENCEIIWGIKPYQIGYGVPIQTKQMIEKRIYHSNIQINDSWKPLLVGSNINRYSIIYKNVQFIKYGKNLMYPSNEEKILHPKILLRQTSDKIQAAYDTKKFYCQNSVFIITSHKFELKYLLGLLNSRLFNFLYRLENPQKGKVFAEIKPSVIKSLPIKNITPNNSIEKSLVNDIIKNVDLLLKLNEEKQETKLQTRIDQLQTRIDYAEEQINKAVYKLYDLTEDEIKIVEAT